MKIKLKNNCCTPKLIVKLFSETGELVTNLRTVHEKEYDVKISLRSDTFNLNYYDNYCSRALNLLKEINNTRIHFLKTYDRI